ncbi:F-box/FBD/LRR-repeat protein At1g16930-like [Impatiens glandulifera]|uniref:F-box/FBD/LRR-repeat protein At1g16930-like n=1 Tax=Impatiens glandulifera TaxID=253017 RepID=UPI001FB133A2|nr:F-box/FBD/LRR-repeat protein At1g16930-like [Impatiens glandulifera]
MAGKMSGSSSNDDGYIKEQERLLPIANVGRIMKQILPANAKISKEAKETMQECVSEFISFVTSEASDKCKKERRKTVNGDDICWALGALGFDDYWGPINSICRPEENTKKPAVLQSDLSRGVKAVELMDDPLSALPDHVLSKIIRKLDLKEAVRTSILSKRWRYIWTHYRELEFNHVNILGMNSRLERNEWVGLDTDFVKWVDKIMEQRFEGDIRKVNSFYIKFPLGASFSSSINSWIDFVVANNVETIDLDLSSCLPLERHTFSLLRAVSNNEIGTLKYLRLTHCNFQGRSSCPKFGSLISIRLESVTISNLQLDRVLESCPLLEELSLDRCINLTKLKIGYSENNNNCTLLKYLSLINCLNLLEIDVIRAQNLTYLELEDLRIDSLQLEMLIKRCPLLEELSLHRCNNLTELRIGDSENNNCTLLKHLSLINCWQVREIDLIRAQYLTSLELEDVTINSLQLEMIIKHCPLLEELCLNRCPQVKYLRILESNNSPLKFLYMMNCWELLELQLCANLLHTLECNVMIDWFPVMKTPNLVNVFIGELIDFHHPLTKITHDIPSLENLIIGSYHSLNYFFANDELVPALSLRRLVLSVNLCFNDGDEILYVSYILKAFPLLETLELNFNSISKFDINEEKMTVDKCPNGTITKVEINGFNGNQRVVNVLMYLLENLTGLRELVISPFWKRYRSLVCWSNEEATTGSWFQCNYEWLRTIVPLNVDLTYSEDMDSDSDLL